MNGTREENMNILPPENIAVPETFVSPSNSYVQLPSGENAIRLKNNLLQ